MAPVQRHEKAPLRNGPQRREFAPGVSPRAGRKRQAALAVATFSFDSNMTADAVFEIGM
jgi:hypothetical protein